MLRVKTTNILHCRTMAFWTPTSMVRARRQNTYKTKCDADFLRTNMLADYLDKMSTDVNYITYIEEEDDYLQLLIVIGIFIYMFYAPKEQ